MLEIAPLGLLTCFEKVFDGFSPTYTSSPLCDWDECINFGVRRSKVKVTVGWHMLEIAVYGRRH